MAAGSTRALAVRGATWATLGIGLQRAVQTLSVLVLARLLVPEDFGLVAIAVLVLNLVNRVKTLGLHTSLVQYQGDIGAAADACFVINGALTVATILVLVALSPVASTVFDPRAGALVAVMSLRLVPQTLAAVPATLAVRALDFRKQALIQAAEGLVGAAIAIPLAFAGWGPWALVVGFLVGSCAGAALWWVRPVWRPRWRYDRQIGEQLIQSGIRIWSAANLAMFVDSANRLFVGGLLGVVRLGYYEIVGRVVHTPIQTLQGIHDRVAISAFCREQDDPARVGRWFLRLSGLMVILTSSIAGSLAVFPDLLIPTLFGPGWEAAIEPARALAPFALLAPLLSTAPVFIAARRTGLLLKLTTVRSVLTIGALFAAAHVSLTAVCMVESLAALLFAPINLAVAARITSIGVRQVLSTFAVPAAGLAAFLATGAALRTLDPGAFASPGVGGLAGLLVPSAAALGLTVLAMRPRLVGELRSIVSESFGTR
ncbi:MAG: oligosaccharide flippase family protein [Thermoanaerobaculales bacterium]|jgi:PST family polysaccharide transporter|nr:oligosaccharide flippase family protein [Thermoanaerobaculales bacterium]